MKNPYLIKNTQGHYWLATDGAFVHYHPATEREAALDLGLTLLQVDAELMAAMKVDVVATLTCADTGPCLPKGHRYWDGRYSKFTTVIAATETNIWSELDGGRIEETSKSFYDHHLNAGVYSLPRS